MAMETPVDTIANCNAFSSGKDRVLKTPANERRYTPYTKSNQRATALRSTPLPSLRARNNDDIGSFNSHQRKTNGQIRRKQRSLRNCEDEIDADTLSTKVVNKTWRIHRVSPLYSFKTDSKNLKLYERRLNSFLESETYVAGTELERTAKKKSAFTRLKGDNDLDIGVEIRIETADGKGGSRKEHLIAILCGQGGSVGNGNKENMGNANNSSDLTSLPICLIKSNVLLRESFLQWLEGEFGCRASPLLFSPIDLAWLVTLSAGIGEPTNSVELTYATPTCIPQLDSIYMRMDAKDAKKIWNIVHDPKQVYFTSDEANRMLKSIEAHFYHHFKIHLNQMRLATVGSSVVYVGQEGRVKILQEPYVCYILQQFLQLANL